MTELTPVVRGIGMIHNSVETWTVTGEAVDPPPIRRQYGKAQYFPDLVKAVHERTNGGPWELVLVELRGPGLTQNGRSTTSQYREEFRSWNRGSAPAWAREWAEASLPSAARGGAR